MEETSQNKGRRKEGEEQIGKHFTPGVIGNLHLLIRRKGQVYFNLDNHFLGGEGDGRGEGC